MTNWRQMDAFATSALAIVAMLSADPMDAAETSATLSPQALQEIAQVEAEIDLIEAQALDRLDEPPNNQVLDSFRAHLADREHLTCHSPSAPRTSAASTPAPTHPAP